MILFEVRYNLTFEGEVDDIVRPKFIFRKGGQAIPAFDFYMAPYVRKTFNEEILKIKNFMLDSNINWENLMNIELKDYIKKPLTDYKDLSEKIIQHAINNTVDRVHQAMESFIHNMNSIHSRGGKR